MQILQPVALERAKIVGVAEGAAQFLEQGKVAGARILPIMGDKMIAEVALDVVVVQQRVVHIEQEDHVMHDDIKAQRTGRRRPSFREIDRFRPRRAISGLPR